MTEMAPPAEAILNGDGEVLVAMPDAPAEVLGWEAGPGPLLRLRLPGNRHVALTLPDEALDAARSHGRILLVSPGADGRPERERWVYPD
jgi:hypothetical protein